MCVRVSLIWTQEPSQGQVSNPGLVPAPKSQGIPAWLPCETADDAVKAEYEVKADGEGIKKKKWTHDGWQSWQDKKDAAKADEKAKPQ